MYNQNNKNIKNQLNSIFNFNQPPKELQESGRDLITKLKIPKLNEIKKNEDSKEKKSIKEKTRVKNYTLHEHFTLNNVRMINSLKKYKVEENKNTKQEELFKYIKPEISKKDELLNNINLNQNFILNRPPIVISLKKYKVEEEKKNNTNTKNDSNLEYQQQKILKKDNLLKIDKKLKEEELLKNTKEKNLDINYLRKIIGLDKEKKPLEEIEPVKAVVKQGLYERGYLKSKRKKRFKLKYFFDLCFILSKLFVGEKPKLISFHLSPLKEEILFLILLRKYKKYFTQKNLSYFQNLKCFKEKLEKMIELLTRQEFKISYKREEENMKFIFNTTLKRMKIKYYQKNNYCYNEENEKKFYNRYFSYARKNKLLEKLFLTKKIHHFNKKDLALYFMAKNFKNDFETYIDEYFQIIYLKEIYKKWENFFKIYEKKYSKYKKCSQMIVTKLRNCTRFKFPWTINEVDAALFSFNKILEKI